MTVGPKRGDKNGSNSLTKQLDSEQFNGFVSGGNATTRNGVTSRKISIQAYGYGDQDNGGNANTNAIYLLIRSPQDLQRERVKFELKALDLM